MEEAAVDLATLAAFLGHSSIRIVQHYVHPTADHKREAMRRFEQVLVEGCYGWNFDGGKLMYLAI
jgi:integrase